MTSQDEGRPIASPEENDSKPGRCCSSCCTTRESDDGVEEGCAWGLAEYGAMHIKGQNREVSKGGSPHVTDETINTMTHLVGLMLSLLGSAVLIAASSSEGKVWHIVSFSIYGTTLMLLFLASTLHHGVHSTPLVEHYFLLFDYIAIFPLIAGTFTPLCLVLFHHSWIGWTFFGSTWLIALIGMLLLVILQDKFPRWISFTMYITLGWMGAFIALFSLPKIGFLAIAAIAFGGVLYSVGGVIFVIEKPNPYPGRFGFHEIWHIFVLAAAATHWIVMYVWILPYPETPGEYFTLA